MTKEVDMSIGRKSCLSVLAIVVLFGLLVGAQPLTAGDVWINEVGSLLVIENIAADGRIEGCYINNAPCTGCRGTPYPLVGWHLPSTNTMTFTVIWNNGHENCCSLTAWTGFFSPTDSRICTLWQLVRTGTWSVDQILQGRDVFYRYCGHAPVCCAED
jgi:hypothetical protein